MYVFKGILIAFIDYDYNVIKKWGSIMTEQTNIVESCCKQTCCADGCCSDGCCSDTVNCCTE